MSLTACIRRWPVTTRSPWLVNSLLPANSSSTEASASFICRNSGSLVVAPEQQRDPGARADAADTDDLAREVGQLELLEQHAAVVLQRAPVGAQQLVQLVADGSRSSPADEHAQRHDQRRLVDDPDASR